MSDIKKVKDFIYTTLREIDNCRQKRMTIDQVEDNVDKSIDDIMSELNIIATDVEWLRDVGGKTSCGRLSPKFTERFCIFCTKSVPCDARDPDESDTVCAYCFLLGRRSYKKSRLVN